MCDVDSLYTTINIRLGEWEECRYSCTNTISKPNSIVGPMSNVTHIGTHEFSESPRGETTPPQPRRVNNARRRLEELGCQLRASHTVQEDADDVNLLPTDISCQDSELA